MISPPPFPEIQDEPTVREQVRYSREGITPPPDDEQLQVKIERAPRQLAEQRSSMRAMKPEAPKTAGQWIAGALAIIAALGGSEGIRAIVGAGSASKVQVAALADRVKDLEEARARDRRFLVGYFDRDSKRWRITSSVICKLNSDAPFARGVDCREITDWFALPMGQTSPVKADIEWARPMNVLVELPPDWERPERN